MSPSGKSMLSTSCLSGYRVIKLSSDHYSRSKTSNEGKGVIILRFPWSLFCQNVLSQIIMFESRLHKAKYNVSSWTYNEYNGDNVLYIHIPINQ